MVGVIEVSLKLVLTGRERTFVLMSNISTSPFLSKLNQREHMFNLVLFTYFSWKNVVFTNLLNQSILKETYMGLYC